MIYWQNGAIWNGIEQNNDVGTMLYWSDGAPFGSMFQVASSTTFTPIVMWFS